MERTRVIRSFLLACVVALGQAGRASVPVPIVATVETPAWSEPVAGLRVRFSSAKDRYKVGEDLGLRLEIQNVSQRALAFTPPEFLPIISAPGEHPFDKNHGIPWVVTAKPIDHAICILWAGKETLRRESTLRSLRPGEIHAVEITGVSGRRKEGLAKEKEKSRENEPQRETIDFAYGHFSGRYRLQVEYRDRKKEQRKEQSGSWQGKRLLTAPIEILIEK